MRIKGIFIAEASVWQKAFAGCKYFTGIYIRQTQRTGRFAEKFMLDDIWCSTPKYSIHGLWM